jgi:hypothetical protein
MTETANTPAVRRRDWDLIINPFGDYIATTSPDGVDYDLTRPLVDADGDWWHAVGHLTVAGHPTALLISTAAGTWPTDIDPDCLLSLPDILEAGYGPLTSAPTATETSAT